MVSLNEFDSLNKCGEAERRVSGKVRTEHVTLDEAMERHERD